MRILLSILLSGIFGSSSYAAPDCLGLYESTSINDCADESCRYAEIYAWQGQTILNFAGVPTDFVINFGEGTFDFSRRWPNDCHRMGCFELLELNGQWTRDHSGACQIRVRYLFQWFHEDTLRPTLYEVESIFHRTKAS